MADVTIQMRKNGPFIVTGPVKLVDAEGNEVPSPAGAAIALCRCGHSSTKPFCDGSHKKSDFQS